MKLTDDIFFYEGDLSWVHAKVNNLYRGIGSSNFIVIKGEKQVLIDSGFAHGPHIKRIGKEMYADGVDINNTNVILFSHVHPDHTVNAKALSKQKSLSFMTHKDNESFIRSERYFFESYFNYPDYVRRELMIVPALVAKNLFTFLGYRFEYLKVDYFFDDMEEINYATDIQVVSLPGHCLGHVGFYFPKYKIFYGADLLAPSLKNAYIFSVNNAFSSVEKCISDLERIKKLDIDIYIPGHGSIIKGRDNVKSFFEKSFNVTQNLVKDILNYVTENRLVTVSNITDTFFDKSFISTYFHAVSIIYNMLMYLKGMDKVGFIIKKHKAYWYAIQ